MDRAQALWVVAVLLVLPVLPLSFGDAFVVETRGHNEELGIGLALAGAIVALAGAALRRGRGWDAKVAAGAAVIVLVSPAVWFVAVIATTPDFDKTRTLEWQHLSDAPTDAPAIDPSSLPANVLAAIRATPRGDRGYLTMPTEEYDRVWLTIDRAVVPPHRTLRLENESYEFFHGAIP